MIKLNQVNKLLLFTLVAILCYAFLLSGTIGVNPVPTYWAASIDYGRQVIVDTGHIYDPGNDTGTHTWQSDLRSYGAQDVLPKIFFAIINIVTNDVVFPDDLAIFSILPIAGLILIPLTLMAFYTYFAKRHGKVNYFDLLLIFMLSVLPLASMVSPGSTNGTMLARGFFLLIIFLIATSANNLRRVILLCFIMAVYFLVYHTWSYYLLIIIMFILTASLLSRKVSLFYLSIYAIAAYIGIGMSLNFYNLIYLPMQNIQHMLSYGNSTFTMIADQSKQSYMSVDPGHLSYTSFTSLYSYLQLENVLLLSLFALPIMLTFFYSLIKRQPISYERLVMSMVLLGAPLCLLSLYALGGYSTMAQRGMEILTYIFVLTAAYNLATLDHVKNAMYANLMRLLIVVIVAICIWSYFNQPATMDTSLSDSEFSGIEFSGLHVPADDGVFSDFRLGATLVYYNMDRIYTIDSTTQTDNGLFQDIMKIYYDDTAPAVTLDRIIGSGQYFVLSSGRQSDVSLVDTSMTSFLKPARKGFEANFEKGDEFNKIYSSNGFSVYGRTDVLP